LTAIEEEFRRVLSKGSVDCREVKKILSDKGYSKKEIRKAKYNLDISTRRAAKNGETIWEWYL
jgi:hypothetical protein